MIAIDNQRRLFCSVATYRTTIYLGKKSPRLANNLLEIYTCWHSAYHAAEWARVQGSADTFSIQDLKQDLRYLVAAFSVLNSWHEAHKIIIDRQSIVSQWTPVSESQSVSQIITISESMSQNMTVKARSPQTLWNEIPGHFQRRFLAVDARGKWTQHAHDNYY